MKKKYYNGDICIVGLGCVLPGADNPDDFWRNILVGDPLIKAMPEGRFDTGLYLNANKKNEDTAYSNKAGYVEDSSLEEISKNLGLKFTGNNRLHIMALESARQALICLRADSLSANRKSAAVFLGCMEVGESYVLEKFFLNTIRPLSKHIKSGKLKLAERIMGAIERYFNKDGKISYEDKISSVFTTSIINAIRNRFGLGGEGILVDAACASSLAAIDAAVNALREYDTNLVITGGMEGNLGPDTFVLFSKVGAMSDGVCHPFDKSADGLSQGEGAVIFALQRLEDAIRDKNKIYGIIKSIGGSSDGRSASLFSPSLRGQILAYERAYADVENQNPDYIECHGTGTKIGDGMEIRSLNEFFKIGKIPVGSVKSLIGHTKGAAGAAGLLKCVLMLSGRIIPPSKYIKSSLAPKNGTVYLNTEVIHIPERHEPIRFGVSSFGFGNINYHLILEEFHGNSMHLSIAPHTDSDDQISVIGNSFVDPDKINAKEIAARFKIPAKNISSIDIIQLSAVAAVADAFKKSNIDIDLLDKEAVSVIAATTLGLDAAMDFVERIRFFELKKTLEFLDEKSLDHIMKYKKIYPEVTEDTGHGVLNNVIAGRICNVFNFKGKNFNIDSDLNSFPAALAIAGREIRKRGNLLILISCDEELNSMKTRVKRGRISCMLLAPLSLAKKNNYPIFKIIRGVEYEK